MTHDDGRQPIAIGHLSDSCDLKIQFPPSQHSNFYTAPFPFSQHRFFKMLAKWEVIEYPYYSCLHEVTFIKSAFECSNSNLVHKQNTVKQLFKLHSSKFTILLFQHNFFKDKKLKIRSFYMKFRKKSGIAQNQEKSGIIRKSGSA